MWWLREWCAASGKSLIAVIRGTTYDCRDPGTGSNRGTQLTYDFTPGAAWAKHFDGHLVLGNSLREGGAHSLLGVPEMHVQSGRYCLTDKRSSK